MGALSQLGLVLLKSIKLRIRQPIILSLEVLWPILIFLIVTLVRRSVPPTQIDSCHFAPRANPSAGFSFAQDFICSLDNKCFPTEEQAQNSRTQAGTASFLQAVMPLYDQRNDTKNFLQKLPDTKKVLDSVTDTLNKPEVKELLDFQPKVKSFLRDPVKVRNYIVYEEQILSARTTDAILDANINITKIFELTGNIDFKGIVCSPAELAQFLVFPPGTSLDAVSLALCSINDSMVGNITTYLQSQIDVSAIIRIIRQLQEASGEYTTAEVLEDLAKLMDILANLNSTNNIFGNLDWLRQTTKWGQNVAMFIDNLMNGKFKLDDLKLIGGVLNDLDPLFSMWFGNSPMLVALRQAFKEVSVVFDWMNGELPALTNPGTYTLGDILHNQTDFLALIQTSFDLSTEVMEALSQQQFNTDQWTKFISAASSGDIRGPVCKDPGLENMFMTNDRQIIQYLQQIKWHMCNSNGTTDYIAELAKALNLNMVLQQQRPDVNIDWTSLLQNIAGIALGLQTSMDSMGPLMNNGNTSIEDMYQNLGKAAMAMNNFDIEKALRELNPMLTQLSYLGGNQTQTVDIYLYIMYTAVDIMESTTKSTQEFGKHLQMFLQNNADLRTILEDLVKLHPQMAPDIFARILDPFRAQVLLFNMTDPNLVWCNTDLLAEFLTLDPTKVNVTAVSNILCGSNISTVLEAVVENFNMTGIQAQIEEMIAVVEGRRMAKPVTYEQLYVKIMALTSNVSFDALAASFDHSFGGMLSALNIDSMGYWQNVGFSEAFVKSYLFVMGGSLSQTLGKTIEDSTVWPSFAPIIKGVYADLMIIQEVHNFMKILGDDNTELGMIVRVFLQYFPEVLYEISQLQQDQMKFQRFITEVTADPTIFCDYTKMSSYLDPIAQLPLQSIQATMCKINYTSVGATVMQYYSTVFNYTEVGFGHVTLNRSDTFAKDINWRHFYAVTEGAANIVTDWINNPSQFDWWSSFNFSRIMDGLNVNMMGLMAYNNQTEERISETIQNVMTSTIMSLDPVSQRMMNYYTYAVNEYVKYLNKYSKIWSENGLLLSDFIGNSSWLQQRVTETQQVLPEILQSLGNVTVNQQKIMMLFSNPNLTGAQLCKDIQLTDFLTFQGEANVKQLETVLCGVNVTLLMQQMLQNPVTKEMTDIIELLVYYNTSLLPVNFQANITELVENINIMMAQLTANSMRQDITSLLFPELTSNFNATEIEMIGQTLMEHLGKLDMNTISQMIDMNTQPLLESFGNMPLSKEAEMALAYIDAIVEGETRYLILYNPDKFNAMFPYATRYRTLMEALPEVMGAVLLGAIETGNTQLMMVASDPLMICNITDIAAVIKLPAGSKVDLMAVQQELCSLNHTKLMMELQMISDYLHAPITDVLTNPNVKVNITQLNNKILYLSTEITKTFTTTNHTIESVVADVMTSLEWLFASIWSPFTEDFMTNALTRGIPANSSHISALADFNRVLNIPELNKQLNMINAILSQVNPKLALVKGSLADMFPNSPELAKLARMMQKAPYILGILAQSYNNPKFQELIANPNMTAAFITLCHPLSDISSIFTLPSDLASKGVSLTALKQEFCSVNFTKLEMEIYQEFNIPEIMVQAQNATPLNWTKLYVKSDATVKHIMKVITSPPMEFQNEAWTNGSVWLAILMAFNQQEIQQNTTANVVNSFYSSVEMLKASLGPSDLALLDQITAAVNQAVMTMNQQIQLIMKKDLSLYDLFANSPEILKFLNATNSTTDLVTALLKIPLANTTALLTLQNETPESLCNKSLAYYKSMFQVADDKSAGEVRIIMCNIKPQTWNMITQELANKIGSAELLAMLGYNFTAANASANATMIWTDLAANIEKLNQNFMTLFGTQFNFQMPAFNQSTVDQEISKLYAGLNAENIDQLLPAIMMSLAPLYGTSAWPSVMMSQQATDVVINYFNDMLALIQPGPNGAVDFEVLFGNSTQWKQLLSGVLDVAPEAIVPLTRSEIGIKNEKLAEIVMLNETMLQQLLCSEKMMREYIRFPATFNVAKVVTASCGVNAATLIQEFNQRFDPQGLMYRLMNPPNASSLNPEAMMQRYNKFVQDIMNLANITNPTFFGKSIADLYNINLTALAMTDPMAAASFASGMVVPNITSVDDAFNFVFETLINTLKQVGELPQSSSYVAFLKIIDTVMKTTINRLDNITKGGKDNVITLGNFVGDIPELENVLKTALKLDPRVVAVLMTADIPTNTFMEVAATGNVTALMMYFCHPQALSWLNITANGNYTSLQELQGQLCSIDYNQLWEKIQMSIDYNKIMPQFMKFINYTDNQIVLFNWTDFTQNITSWKTALDVLIANPPQLSNNLTALIDPTWITTLMTAVVQQQAAASWQNSLFGFMADLPPAQRQFVEPINEFVQQLTGQFKLLQDFNPTAGQTILEKLTNTTYISKLVSSYLQLSIGGPNNNDSVSSQSQDVVLYMQAIVEVQIRYLVLNDPAKFISMFPYLNNYKMILEAMPDIMNGILNSILQDGNTPLKSQILSNPLLICNVSDISKIVKLPAGSTVDVQAVVREMCTMNYTLIVEQLNSVSYYLNEPIINLLSGQKSTANITELMMNIEYLQVELTKMYSGDLSVDKIFGDLIKSFNWADENMWSSLISDVMNNTVSYQNPDDYLGYTSILAELNGALNLADINKQMNLVNAIITQVNAKLVLLHANSTLADMFPNAPEMAKLARMIQHFPYIFGIVANSYNNPKFQALLSNQNLTEVLLALCSPTSDINSILTVPNNLPSQSVSLMKLQQQFCVIDFTKLEAETYIEFNVPEIMAQAQNPTPLNWTALFLKIETTVTQVSKVLSNPPLEFQNQAWTNESLWLAILMTFNQQDIQNTTSDIMQSYYSSMDMLKSLLGNDSQVLDQMTSTVNQFVMYMNQQLELIMKKDLSLYDLFVNSPEILKFLNVTNSTTDLVTALLKIPLANTTALLTLQNETPESLCNKSLAYYKSMFQVADDKSAGELRLLMCNINSQTWNIITQELVNKVGSAELLAMLGYNFTATRGNGMENWTDLAASIDKLNMNIMKLFTTNFTFQLPAFDQNAVEELIGKLYMNMNATNIEEMIPAITMGMAPLYGTSAWDSVSMYQRAADVVISYFNDMLALIQPGQNGAVDFGVLFGNSTQWMQLLSGIFDVSRELIVPLAMSEIGVKNGKLPELILLDEPSVHILLCDEQVMRQYINFPASFNVSMVITVTCGLNATILMNEFEQQFDPQGFMYRLMNPLNAASLNPDAMMQRYNKFVQDIMSLANITNPTFFGKSIADLFNINFTELAMADPIAAASFITGMVTPNITSVEDAVNFMFDTLINTVKQIGVVPQSEGYTASLRVFDSVIKIMLNRLDQRVGGSKGNVLGLSGLFKDIPEVEKLLRTTLSLEPHVVSAILFSNIPTNTIMKVVASGNMSTIKDYFCQPNITLEWLNLTSSGNMSLQELQSQLCNIDYNVLWEKIQVYIDYNKIMPEFMKLLNYTDTQITVFNWTDFAQNISAWKTALDILTADKPQISPNLTQLFNTDWLMSAVNSIVQQQMTQAWQDTAFSFLNDLPDVPMQYVASLNELIHMLTSQFTMLQDNGYTFSKLLSNTTAFKQWYTHFSVMLVKSNLYLITAPVAKEIFAKVPSKASSSDLCSVEKVRSILNSGNMTVPMYLSVENITMALCNHPSSNWFDHFTAAGFATQDIHLIAMKLAMHYSIQTDSYAPTPWTDVQKNLEMLTGVLTQLDDLNSAAGNWSYENIAKVVEAIAAGSSDSVLPITIELLNLVDFLYSTTGNGDMIKQAVHLSAVVLNFTNSRLHEMTDGNQMDLSQLFPDEYQLRSALGQVLSKESIDDVLKLTMDPALLPSLSNLTTWKMLVCNETAFTSIMGTMNVSDVGRLQTELCNAALNGSNAMEILMQYVQFGQFINKITMMTNNNSVIEQNPFKYLESQLRVMLANLEMMEGSSNMTGALNWMSMFTNITQSPLAQLGYTDICSSTLATLDQVIESSILNSALMSNLMYMESYIEIMEIFPLLANVTCDLPVTDLQGIYQRINQSGIIGTITTLTGLITNPEQVNTGTFECARYVRAYEKYTQLNTFYTTNLPALVTSGWQCLMESSEKSLPALENIDNMISLLREFQSLLSDPAFAALQTGPFAQYIDEIIQSMIQQQHLTAKFTDILKNVTDMEISFVIANISQEIINEIMRSTVDLTLSNLWDVSEEQLEQMICNATHLGGVLKLPSTLFNVSVISQELCAANISAKLKQGLDVGKIFSELSQNIPSYTINTDWLNTLSDDLAKLTTSFEPLIGMTNLLSDMDISALIQQLPQIQQFTTNGGLESVIDNISSIVEHISKIISPDDPMVQGILDDLQVVINGLKGLKLINRMNISVYLRDILVSETSVADYMMYTLGLSSDVTAALIGAQFSFMELINLTQRVDLNKLICDPTQLSTLLSLSPDNSTINGTWSNSTMTMANSTVTMENSTVTSNAVTMKDISTELCAMSDQQIVDLVTFVQGEINIGTIVQELINLNPEKILGNIGVDVKEFQQTLQTFAPLQESFKSFSSKLQDLPDELLTSALALQDGNAVESTTELSQLMCGRPEAFNIVDEFQLGSSSSDTPQTSEVEPTLTNGTARRRKKRATGCNFNPTEWQRYERSRFSKPFCRDMYDNLQCSENGRIIWTFLKPLLVGRITYTPINHITKAIIEEATQLFRDVEEIKNFAKIFIDSADSLMEFSNSSNQLTSLEDALKNPLISEAVKNIVGVNPNDLTDQLKSLNSVSKDQLTAMKIVSELLYNASFCISQNREEAYANEETLLKQAHYYADRNELLAAVIFEDMVGDNEPSKNICDYKQDTNVQKHMKVKIRMDLQAVTKTESKNDFFWLPGPEDSFADKMRYFRGFIQLQDLLERAIIKMQTGCEGAAIPSVVSEQFPYPCYEEDLFQKYVSLFMFPVMMVLSWLVIIGSSIRSIVYDKEHRLEEAMQAMGLKSGINWLGWFLNTFLFMVLMDLIIVFFLKFGNLYRFSHFGLLFVYLVVFSFSITMMCYLISVFFYRTTLAALVGLIVYLVSYIPYIILANLWTIELEFWQIFLACLSSTTAFSYGAQMLAHMEQRGIGMQFSDVTNENLYANFSFAWVMYMMLIDSGIYLVLGWYLRHVLPGKYGVSYPWYFPFSPRYWGCGCYEERRTSALNKPRSGANQNVYDGEGSVQGIYIKKFDASPSFASSVNTQQGFENRSSKGSTSGQSSNSTRKSATGEPINLPVGISLHNLTKKFGNKKAVSGVTVDFYQDQITAFLGQNGAGKSTTVHMLTGIHEVTSGDAFINKHSIRTNMTMIRKDLGICPQHDVLFEYMTVYEHLDFYASLKGKQSGRERKEDISRMLDLTGLRMSAPVKASQLSGGQRRRLSVAIAFIGGSNVVILDEPTSGIDSCARRSIWDLILQNRAGRTIILSTHHLDEADVLGDRIVLMHKGKVLTTGSPLYLKSQFGSGYTLTMSKQLQAPHYADAGNEESTTTSAVLAFLLKYVPNAKLVEEVGTEMTFILPTHEGQLSTFPEMFNQLEYQKNSLGVSNYGVSDSTIEEVFLKLTMTADAGKEIDPIKLRSEYNIKVETRVKEKGKDAGSSLNGIERPTHSAAENSPNCLVQIFALLYKRFWHHLMDVRSYLSQIILPILFICLAMGMAMILPETKNQPSLLLTPDMYRDSYTFYRLNSNNNLFKSYEELLVNAPYAEPSCLNQQDQSICTGPPNIWQTQEIPSEDYSKYEKPGNCSCENGRQICPVGASGFPSPYIKTNIGMKTYNLTGNQFPVSEYLSRTLNDFVQERYGGWSFSKDGEQLKGTVWYNNKGFHALPAFQNGLSNLILRSRLQQQNVSDFTKYGISVYNHPLDQSKEQLSQQTLLQSIAENGLAIIILCAFCFVPAGYTIFLVGERVNKEKRLQLIYGVGIMMYWFTALLWDMITYMFSVGLAVLVVFLFGSDIYNDRLNLAAFTVTLVLFGWACIPLMYLLCRMFKEVSTAYITVFLVNFIIGVSTVICIFLLSLFLYIDVIKDVYFYLNHIFKIFPQFCLGDALVTLSRNQFITRIYNAFNIDKYENPFTFDQIAWHLVAMGIQGFVFFILNLMLEANCRSSRRSIETDVDVPARNRLNTNNKGIDHREDNDVGLERQRVRTGDARGDTLVLHNLRKIFKRGFKKVVAVENISLGVPKGECFGFLGVNGAGKTTTFNMITGEIHPTRGAAVLNGRIISENAARMEGEVGYCPQFDALDDYLTGRQLLYFYSYLKGVPHAEHAINGLIQGLGLEQYANTLVKRYSGGTKRKLSTAIALLGNPKLIMLDEPTTGMDAGSRRKVWDRIIEVIKGGTSVILTSHSMSECDALCTRMAITVNGSFKCLGNGQQLKYKYGTGYTVITRVSGIPPDLRAVINFMQEQFPGSFMKESHLNQLEFEIPIGSVSLGEIFGRLEGNKSMLHLQEYSVCQPTLDQVFVNFARCQTDGLEEENELDIEEGGHIKAYANPAYSTLGGTPHTPVLPRGREIDVRESLKSIPGYGRGEIDSSEITVDVSDKPSTSTSPTSSHSPSSSVEKERPISSAASSSRPDSSAYSSDTGRPVSSEIAVVDPDTGDAQGQISHDDGVTIVAL